MSNLYQKQANPFGVFWSHFAINATCKPGLLYVWSSENAFRGMFVIA